MKTTFPRLAVIACAFAASLLVTAPPLRAQNSAQDRYNAGVRLFNEGQFVEALEHFETVLRASPNHVYARSYVAKCRKEIANNAGPKNDLEGKLAKLVLPEINFVEAPLGDVLDYLSARALALSEGQLVVNFIYTGSPEMRAETVLSLSLRNVPMNEAVKYVGQLTRSRVKYEPHAIVIDPGVPATAAPAPETDPAATQTKSTFQ
jgi:tetratricopeptide (TPR) repeat protein